MKHHLTTDHLAPRLRALFADISHGQLILLLAIASWLVSSVLLVSAWHAAKLALRHLA